MLGGTEEQELTAAEAEDAGYIAEADRPCRRGLGQGSGRPRPAGEPLLLRLHRHPQGPDAGDVRHLNPDTGKYEPFHLYSMRQAIEEGFILDVLANYTTYKTYWRIEKTVEDDPEYPAGQGAAGHRPLRHAPPSQPGPEGRNHRRALPRTHRAQDRRTWPRRWWLRLPAARCPLQAGDRRRTSPGEGLHRPGSAGRVLGDGYRRQAG